MKTLLDLANQPPPTDCPFEIGQTVRILPSVVEDGQTPDYWAGATVKVLKVRAKMFSKEWMITCEHENGAVDDFRSYELDGRYIKNRRTKRLTL